MTISLLIIKDYIRNALALVSDVGFIYGNRVSQYVKSDLTVKLIGVLEKFPNPENQNMVVYARKVPFLDFLINYLRSYNNFKL